MQTLSTRTCCATWSSNGTCWHWCAPGKSRGLARLYLNPKFVRRTRAPPSPSATPIAPIGGAWENLGGGGH
nr:MAG TPA: Esterase GDSL/SGNH-like Acyl-Esterase family found in Pmr5 and Cas1p [Caudoviricetes sp.]